jgi:hypothetical protein
VSGDQVVGAHDRPHGDPVMHDVDEGFGPLGDGRGPVPITRATSMASTPVAQARRLLVVAVSRWLSTRRAVAESRCR